MKQITIFLIAALIFISCKKDPEIISPHHDYSVKITASMSDSTMYFDVFVKTDTFWIFVTQKNRYEIEHGKTGFNVPYFECNGKTYPVMSNPIKAAVRERYGIDKYRGLDSIHVAIIKN